MKRLRILYRNLKLSNQFLLWFLLIALVPFGVLSVLIYNYSISTVEKEGRDKLLAVAERQAKQIWKYGDERERDITALSRSHLVHSLLTGEADESSELRTMLRTYREAGVYQDSLLIQPDGTIVFADNRIELVGGNVLANFYLGSQLQQIFQRTITLLSTDFSDFEYSDETGEAVAYLSTPIFANGVLEGVMLLRVDTQEIYRLVNDREGLGRTGETMLARSWQENVQYVSPLREDPGAAFQRVETEGDLQQAVSGRKGTGTITDYRGERALAAWWYVPFFRWGVIVKMDESEVYASADELSLLFALFGTGTAGFVAFAGLRVARSISRPIEVITDAANQMDAGNLSRPINVHTGNEIGILARSFNHMAARIKEIVENLDALVDERTKQLGEKNRDLEQTLEKLKVTQDKLVQQEKMASLGGLTAGIAHEIKNPLNFVNNFSELSADLVRELKAELDQHSETLPAETKDLISEILTDLEQNARKIREHGKRADSIVRGMLLHSRGAAGQSHRTQINELLDEYVNLAYHGLRAKDSNFNVTIERDYDPNLAPIDVVPQDISRVFLNIVNNGCYAAYKKKLDTRGSFTPTIKVQTRDRGEWCEIRIQDNGIGIPPSQIEKVFDPFFTTKPPGEGTGLGLSLSYETVVSEHHGEIRVESKAYEGAAFIIRLPKRAKKS